MKFEEGNSVEVLKREHKPCGSWFPGSIISVFGDYYIVRYDSPTDSEGEPVMEKVHKEDVRPQPPLKRGKRWMVGDVADVFDTQCWRVGKVAKSLKNNLFVIKLFGSIKLKEFHESNLRIRQVWHNNNWSVIGKLSLQVAQNKESTKNFMQNKSKLSGSLVCSSPLDELIVKDSSLGKRNEQRGLKDGHNNAKKCHPARMVNRSNMYRLDRSSKDLFSKVGGCRRPLTRNLHLFRRVVDVSSPEVKEDEKFNGESWEMDADIASATSNRIYSSSRPLSTEDSDQCSVASCSSNDFALTPSHYCNKAFENTSYNSDAESSYPSSSVNILTPYFEQKLEADIHELEFHAYKSTVQALYASGPLSWEQESLLTNLRLSLHISDEEYLLQLRHLLSTQVL
ncbi:uncharacterized protein LOC110631741 isoform X1 [Hevea brasiliensis]|uniref:uncharacterized protein LOC110631741 isoform X1 n=1 Tax=Hevea brasiliensis TaxID=3981 RepID=UPI0025F9197B|nr:uncharacterized protein LOC110631741 isoform X1 [Hevea brasiliensis]XP_021635378.2 uncharacterized protein LOC110631741 isoform X1 [Hevea brasiliensis]XP_021635379.2 uncharacterized protein LOC110631741 isoform X1 [Hevea brasiliensis]XP_058008734.1 uncharacterized protein LOC110631741 isoform X1 [Hevea brasiliensis]